jgi:hypothetical protein
MQDLKICICIPQRALLGMVMDVNTRDRRIAWCLPSGLPVHVAYVGLPFLSKTLDFPTSLVTSFLTYLQLELERTILCRHCVKLAMSLQATPASARQYPVGSAATAWCHTAGSGWQDPRQSDALL